MPRAGFEPRLLPTPRGNQDRPTLWVGVGSLAGTEHSAALSTGGFSIRRVRETVHSRRLHILQMRYFQMYVPQWSSCPLVADIRKSVVKKFMAFQSQITRESQDIVVLTPQITYSSRIYNCEKKTQEFDIAVNNV